MAGGINYNWNFENRIFQEASDGMNFILIWLRFFLEQSRDGLVYIFSWIWSWIYAFIQLDCFQKTTETGNNVWIVSFWSFFTAMVLVWLADQLVVKRICRLTQDTGRYFLLHALFNFWVVALVIQDAAIALFHPETAILNPGWVNSTIITMAGISAFHVYHCLAFENLTTEDYIHHGVGAGLVPIIGMLCPFGRVASLSNLGMCGLPGGIDYLMLTAVKIGQMDTLTEKRYNRLLNLLIRWPLQLLSHYLIFRVWMLGYMKDLPGWQVSIMIITCFIHSFNATYYADKVIGNYYLRTMKMALNCPLNNHNNKDRKAEKNKGHSQNPIQNPIQNKNPDELDANQDELDIKSNDQKEDRKMDTRIRRNNNQLILADFQNKLRLALAQAQMEKDETYSESG